MEDRRPNLDISTLRKYVPWIKEMDYSPNNSDIIRNKKEKSYKLWKVRNRYVGVFTFLIITCVSFDNDLLNLLLRLVEIYTKK